MVELHLFVVEGQGEENGSCDVVVCGDKYDGPERETETCTVVLEVSVIDKNEGRLEEN